MTPKRIVVAGGGIGGLTAAIALAQHGHEVEVLEQAPVLGASVGAGVTLAPNAMRVYAHLGLEAALCARGIEPRRQRVQHWRDGRILLALERGDEVRAKYGVPYLYIHRADLHAVLIDALEATGRGRVRLGATVTGAELADDGAAVVLASGDRVAGDIVVAADGVKSPIRRLFETDAPHFSGHIAWRALVPVEGPELRDLAEYPGVHVGPGRMVVRYPVSDGRDLNLVFFARQEGWAEEGWGIPGRRAELETTFDGWAAEVGTLIAAVDEQRLFKWGIFARNALPTWVHGGRIVLLGDAAHAMTPFMGQGASSASEDALVLARALDAADTPEEGLHRYEQARIARCSFIQAESNANADRMQGSEGDLFGMKSVRNEETLGLFDYDAGAVDV